jgi:hypothetical protein
MAINFRGKADQLNKKSDNRNASGFQEKSAPGPRQGVGGRVHLKQAEAMFAKRRSPAKINKNFYGGEAYFQDGYDGDMANPITNKSKSPAKKKAFKPHKMYGKGGEVEVAKTKDDHLELKEKGYGHSPAKINMALIDGEKDVLASKQSLDYAAEVKKGFGDQKPPAQTANLSGDKSKEESDPFAKFTGKKFDTEIKIPDLSEFKLT